MAKRKPSVYKKKFSDGRTIVFGIRDGQVRKISVQRFPENDFRQALAEARKALLGSNSTTIQSGSLPAWLYRDAAAHDLRMRNGLPDF